MLDVIGGLFVIGHHHTGVSDPRADKNLHARAFEGGEPFHVALLGAVNPACDDQVLRQARDHFRMFRGNITPEHHLLVIAPQQACNAGQIVHIDLAVAFLFNQVFAAPLPQFKGLVAPDVVNRRWENREHLLVHAVQKIEHVRVFRCQHVPVRALGNAAVLLEPQHLVHVSAGLG